MLIAKILSLLHLFNEMKFFKIGYSLIIYIINYHDIMIKFYCYSNGQDWYRLRNSIRQLMLRKQEVRDYLPLVREVANDFVKRIKQKVEKNEAIENLDDEIGKWSQECKYLSVL
jgi:hypothetical protein